MEIKSTINIILKDLEEARTLIEDLKNYPGVPLLQIELAKAKCRSAEDVIRLLVETGASFLIPAKEPTNPEKEPLIPEEKRTPSHTVLHNKVKPDNNPAQDPEQRSQKITRLVDEIVSNENPKKEPKAEKEKGKKIIADSFSHMSDRINERLGDQKRDDDRGDKISIPFTNLSKAIGINDRFLFIREVFNGDNEQYSRVIDQIDTSTSLGSAIEIIKENTNHKIDEEPVKQLIEIVKRKFTH